MAKSTRDSEILQEFRLSRLIIPVLIGIAVLAYAIYKVRQEDINFITDIDWQPQMLGWLIVGVIFMLARDLGYTWRMRILTEKKLSWRNSLEITLLWEFASAMTPSVVGGSALAIFMLVKEKISAGKSTAIVFITIFLDELFYIIILPLLLLFVSYNAIFDPINGQASNIGTGLAVAFWIAYGVLILYTSFLALALFIKPDWTSNLIKRLFKGRLLRRWKDGAAQLADDLLVASREYRGKPAQFWLWGWVATFAAWMGRYLVLNAVLAMFTGLTIWEHLEAFARQVVMFQVMLVSPTPGGSGFAEGAFRPLMQEFSPEGMVLILAVLWRLITYYPYLFIGIPLLPRWLRRVYGRRKAPTVGLDGVSEEELGEDQDPPANHPGSNGSSEEAELSTESKTS
ncbi:MAG: lysylphosphatidylglycerol synthase transmembrane domain-containing protein [Bacteroidota bacterium]